MREKRELVMRHFGIVLLIVVLNVLWVRPVVSHHSREAYFDMDAMIEQTTVGFTVSGIESLQPGKDS